LHDSPRFAELAQRIVALATRETVSSEEVRRALDEMFMRLYHVTSAIVGDDGCLALWARSVHQTAEGFPWLRLPATVSGRAFPHAGLHWPVPEVGIEEVATCAGSVLAHLLDLLESFIGDELVRSLVSRAWPELTPRIALGKRA
jgi:hypothetical protein